MRLLHLKVLEMCEMMIFLNMVVFDQLHRIIVVAGALWRLPGTAPGSGKGHLQSCTELLIVPLFKEFLA